MIQKRTKIIATFGPGCNNKNTLRKMIKGGVNVFRFNFSHGTHQDHQVGMQMIRSLNEELETSIAILADLQGPKIRIGEVENGQVELRKGMRVVLSSQKQISTQKTIFVHYNRLSQDVKKGDRILMDDGKIQFLALEVLDQHRIEAEVLNSGKLRDRKGVNMPDTDISVPSLTEKDKKDLVFALAQGVNWVALSFVRHVNDITYLKTFMQQAPSHTRIISKIEKPEAIQNIDAIIDASDAIMVARGDLGVEVPLERVPIMQKNIVSACINRGRPVIIATQMMESMISNPAATRAEINDVANAVLDGADAVMLSGETSIGKYPTIVIRTMNKVIKAAEKSGDIYYKDVQTNKKSITFLSDAICYNACYVSKSLQAKAIIGMTHSGYTAFMVSSVRPKSAIYIFTNDRGLIATLNICWGVKAFYYDKFEGTNKTIDEVIETLKKEQLLSRGDVVVNTASIPLRARGKTNMLKVSKVK